MTNLLYSEQTYQIIGAAMEVHKELGAGFLEAVYQEAMEIELRNRNIPYVREQLVNIYYKKVKLEKFYSADFLCFGNIVLELKALSEITGDNQSQLINYLKATKLPIGMLINFGGHHLEYKRMIL